LGVTKDGLEMVLPIVYMLCVVGDGFLTLGLSALFYFEYSYVAPIRTNYWFLNSLIVPSIGFAFFVNFGNAAFLVSLAAIYGNTTTIWLKYLRSVKT